MSFIHISTLALSPFDVRIMLFVFILFLPFIRNENIKIEYHVGTFFWYFQRIRALSEMKTKNVQINQKKLIQPSKNNYPTFFIPLPFLLNVSKG